MIVCSCNVICHRKIEAVVERMFRADPNVVLTPGKVYKAVGHRPKCATCLFHIAKLMHAHRENLEKETPQEAPQEPPGQKPSPKSRRPATKDAQAALLELEEF